MKKNESIKEFVRKEFWKAVQQLLQERDRAAAGMVFENYFTIKPNERQVLSVADTLGEDVHKIPYLDDFKRKVDEKRRKRKKTFEKITMTVEEHRKIYPNGIRNGVDGWHFDKRTGLYKKFVYKLNEK